MLLPTNKTGVSRKTQQNQGLAGQDPQTLAGHGLPSPSRTHRRWEA